MTFSLRTLALAVSLSGPVLLAACSSSKEDPKPVQPTIEYGAVIGYANPIAALTSVTATAADGTTYQAQLNTSGSYVFGKLPVGNYTLTYTAATGYVAPASQTITVIVNYTLPLATLTVQPVIPPKQAMLTSPRWRLTSDVEVRTTAAGVTTTTDRFPSYSACRRDDFLKFNLDGTYVYDEGPTKCSPSDPQTSGGTWALSADETELIVTPSGSSAGNIPIKLLTATTLQLSSSFVDNGTTYASTQTYTAF